LITHNLTDEGLETTVIDVEGKENLKALFPIKQELTEPQQIGSMISYAKRYNITSIFNLIIQDEDDDGKIANDKAKQTVVFGDKELQAFIKARADGKVKADTIEEALKIIE
jgi:hypothetical protein